MPISFLIYTIFTRISIYPYMVIHIHILNLVPRPICLERHTTRFLRLSWQSIALNSQDREFDFHRRAWNCVFRNWSRLSPNQLLYFVRNLWNLNDVTRKTSTSFPTSTGDIFLTKGRVTRGNFPAIWNAMALHCKLQGRLPRVTPHVCN